MRSYKSVTQCDQEDISMEVPSLEVSDAANQCNTMTDAMTEDPNSEPKTPTFEGLPTDSGLDRYLSRLHSNLDSRFPISNAVSTEMKRVQPVGFMRVGVQPTKRLTFITSRTPESERPIDGTTSVLLKNERKIQRSAKEWPNPLTSNDQAILTQQFCTYFYQRYCTPLGDLALPDAGSKPTDVNDPTTLRTDAQLQTSWRGDPQGLSGSTPPGYRHALCPYFFTSSLADAMKTAERPAGRPWPAILLYLHHDQSVHTAHFVKNILCSLREDYKCSDPVASNGQIGTASESSPDRPVPTKREEDKISVQRGHLVKQDRSTTANLPVLSPTVSAKPRRSSLMFSKPDSHQIPVGHSSEKLQTTLIAGSGVGKFTSNNVPGTSPRCATLERDNLDPRPSEMMNVPMHKRSISGSSRPVLLAKTTNVNSGSEIKQDSFSLLFPSRNYGSDLDEQVSMEPNSQLVIAPGDGEYVEPESGAPVKEESGDARANETSYMNKSFRGLLLERSAGLIPWDCTEFRARSYLAAAFPGTRLVQWLAQWQMPDFYPVLVAVGRNAEREVVCSHLCGATATAESALRWLSDVTVAHFHNYREPSIPTCPERSERLIPSPNVSSTPSAEHLMLPTKTLSPVNHTCHVSPTLPNTCTQPTTVIRTVNSAKAGSTDVTQHTFISMLNMRPNPKRGLSPGTMDDIAYRVTKTPQVEQGPLSSLFELPLQNSSRCLREHLKRVQTSFKTAASVLAKSMTAESLADIGISVPLNGTNELFGSGISVTSQMLVDTLCKTSSMELASQMRSSVRGEISRSQSNPKQHAIQTDHDPSATEIGPYPKRNSLSASCNSDQQINMNVKHLGTKHKRSDQILSLRSSRGSNDRQTGSSNPSISSQIGDRWWFVMSTKPPTEELDNGVQFYQEFRERFTKEFPSTPAFIIGRLHTAVLRSMDVMNHVQISPILIYLHDKRAPGVDHFVANVMCSRRFTNKLFDHRLHVWPLDVSNYPQKRARMNGLLRSFRSFERSDVKRTKSRHSDLTTHSLTEADSSVHKFRAHRRPASSFGRFQVRPNPDPSQRSLWHQKDTDVDHSESVGTGRGVTEIKNMTHEAPHSTWTHTVMNRSSVAAQQLLDYFAGHPAQESIRRILSIPVLPSIINVSYRRGTFFVTHILVPSSTTKEAIAWLSTVIKLYSKSRSH